MPDMPARLKRLPMTGRGYPALFFAAVVDGEPDIRRVSAAKFHRCINERLCWLCGESLEQTVAFVLTERAVKESTWTEPPCHIECAEYAMQVCPFITDPDRHYRNGAAQPEAYRLYLTESYRCGPLRNTYPVGVITLGPPTSLEKH